MKILFYGGCHGAAMRRIVERFGQNVSQVEHLTNFVLIRDSKPFPYEKVKNFDIVIFNPIFNKKEYNTIHLESFCEENNIKTFKYPWIQWEGYYPTIKKVGPSWYSGWWLSGLDSIADSSCNYQDFIEQVYDGNALHAEALENVVKTSDFLARLELATDVKILPFILEHFRFMRLFLTPDHGTAELYKFIIREISSSIGLKIDPAFYYTNQEVQSGIRIPVLPSVARALKLDFAGGGDFQSHLVLGENIFTLGEYLKFHYFRNQVRIATAVNNTRFRQRDTGQAFPIKRGVQVVGIASDEQAEGGYNQMEFLGFVRGETRRRFPIPTGRALNYFRGHWRLSSEASVATDHDARSTLSEEPEMAENGSESEAA